MVRSAQKHLVLDTMICRLSEVFPRALQGLPVESGPIGQFADSAWMKRSCSILSDTVRTQPDVGFVPSISRD
jgi:hypothetical protein